MSLTKLAIKIAAPLPKIENYERFLFIGPHPDDIEIGAGATAAKLASAGKKICFLICTDGRYGDAVLKTAHPEWTPEELADRTARIREQECRASAAYLGVEDVRFLRLSDGGFYDFAEMAKDIAQTVSDFKPDVIFAPDPNSKSESHIDHLNTGRAAGQIACFAPYEGIMRQYGESITAAPVQAIAYYMTARPNQKVSTTGFLQRQMGALKNCHLSQYPKGGKEFDSIELYLKLRSAEYGIKCGHRAAEAFRVLGQTHMHCLPEAGE